MSKNFGSRRSAFTFVELLVVIGIIAMLIALLMPALGRARDQANSVKCKANLKDIGEALVMYANDNQGVIFPVGIIEVYPGLGNSPLGNYRTLGNGSPWTDPSVSDPSVVHPGVIAPEARWPTYVFGVWNPPQMICPNDDPGVLATMGQQHSYVLNKHLEESPTKMVLMGPPVLADQGTSAATVRSAAEVVVMGEKVAAKGDYYMEMDEFKQSPPTVDLYKHGIRIGSNYLYMDWHVDTQPPQGVESSLDPWDATGADLGSTPPT